MDKRTFLKNSSLLVGGVLIQRMISCSPKNPEETMNAELLKNWAENFEFSTANVHYPKTVEEVQALVKKCEKLRILGSRHSFNRIADSKDNLISFQNLNRSNINENTKVLEQSLLEKLQKRIQSDGASTRSITAGSVHQTSGAKFREFF